MNIESIKNEARDLKEINEEICKELDKIEDVGSEIIEN